MNFRAHELTLRGGTSWHGIGGFSLNHSAFGMLFPDVSHRTHSGGRWGRVRNHRNHIVLSRWCRTATQGTLISICSAGEPIALRPGLNSDPEPIETMAT